MSTNFTSIISKGYWKPLILDLEARTKLTSINNETLQCTKFHYNSIKYTKQTKQFKMFHYSSTLSNEQQTQNIMTQNDYALTFEQSLDDFNDRGNNSYYISFLHEQDNRQNAQSKSYPCKRHARQVSAFFVVYTRFWTVQESLISSCFLVNNFS